MYLRSAGQFWARYGASSAHTSLLSVVVRFLEIQKFFEILPVGDWRLFALNQVNFLAQCACGKALCKFEQPMSLTTCFEKSWTLKKHQFFQVLTETSRGPNLRGDPLQAYQRLFHYSNSVVGAHWQRLPSLGSIGTVSVEKLTKTNCTRRCRRSRILRSLVGLPEHLIQRVGTNCCPLS